MTQFQEEKAKRKLGILRRKEEEESVKLVSQKYKIPYIDLSRLPIEVDAIKTVPEEKARSGDLAVFQSAGRRLKIAVRNPEKKETRAILRGLEEERFIFDLYLASRYSLERAWGLYRLAPETHEVTAGAIQVSREMVESLRKEIKTFHDIKERVEATYFGRTTGALEIILAGALVVNASDVHIEPQAERARLRFRIDGVLHDITVLPLKLFSLLMSRIKLISELKLNIRDNAQDGRFTIRTAEVEIEVRTSTLPGPDGENVVMRILNPQSIQLKFEELGMQPWISAAMKDELKKPNGMILTTGPTGSGKTTTLYTFLRKVHTPEIKIITLEDPIEYHLPGIEQTQVETKKGYDFAGGLRAIMRQDPDVILVGEIRDFETADTAMNAALTGHLVFSTLHTNNAAGAVPRLMNLGVKPETIAPALNVAMAQRLVRRLCLFCKKPLRPGASRRAAIEKELAGLPGGVAAPDSKTWTIFEAAGSGCGKCSGFGYKGRISVFEIILMDDKMGTLVLKSPSEYEMKKAAFGQGQITLRQDGLLKILAGITDFAEVERVVGV